MNWIPNIFRRHRLFDDLSEEMRLHIDEHAARLIEDGLSPQEAQRRAWAEHRHRRMRRHRAGISSAAKAEPPAELRSIRIRAASG